MCRMFYIPGSLSLACLALLAIKSVSLLEEIGHHCEKSLGSYLTNLMKATPNMEPFRFCICCHLIAQIKLHSGHLEFG